MARQRWHDEDEQSRRDRLQQRKERAITELKAFRDARGWSFTDVTLTTLSRIVDANPQDEATLRRVVPGIPSEAVADVLRILRTTAHGG